MLLGWVRTRGAAVIYSVSVVYSRREEPHAVVLADLPEGVRIMSSVVDCAASDVWIGQRVQLRVTELDGVAVPVCEAAGPS